jgi:ribosome-binding ATPase YchF (GTP1/OBG family)
MFATACLKIHDTALAANPGRSMASTLVATIVRNGIAYIANVGDEELGKAEHSDAYKKLAEHARKEGSPIVQICGKIEAEIAEHILKGIFQKGDTIHVLYREKNILEFLPDPHRITDETKQREEEKELKTA